MDTEALTNYRFVLGLCILFNDYLVDNAIKFNNSDVFFNEDSVYLINITVLGFTLLHFSYHIEQKTAIVI